MPSPERLDLAERRLLERGAAVQPHLWVAFQEGRTRTIYGVQVARTTWLRCQHCGAERIEQKRTATFGATTERPGAVNT